MKRRFTFFPIAFSAIGSLLVVSTIAQPKNQPTQTQLQAAFPDSSSSVFEKGQQMSLLWIDPPISSQKPITFHGCHVRRERIITDPKLKEELRAALNAAIANNTGNAAKCFIPHHGLRVSQGNQSVDLIICFECRRLVVYSGHNSSSSIITPSQSTELLFNRLLR